MHKGNLLKEKLEIYFDVTFECEECASLIEVLKDNEDFLDSEERTIIVALRRKLEERCYGYTSD